MQTDRINTLSQKITQASDAYYNGVSEMEDEEFDSLVDELSKLDPSNPVLMTVGAEPSTEEWIKEKHLYPLGSLNKVNTAEEMTAWIKDTLGNRTVLVSEKMDGLSLGCQYDDGELTKALLRGGSSGYGENILANVVKMKGVVKSIPGFNGVIRGEIILLKSDHQTHYPEYSNPRNAASGLCRRLDGEGSEHLTFVAYQVFGDYKLNTEEGQFKLLTECGFTTPNYRVCKTDKEVNQMWGEYETTRNAIGYEIDGLVVACNDLDFQRSLKEHNSRPKGKLAYKFPNQFVTSTVKEIRWETGGMSRVSPVCWIEPVEILGSIVQKASVYNIAYIKKLGLDVGAEVEITKAGEIIPRIERVIKGTGTTASIPTNCPTCDTILIMDGEYLTCPNSDGCQKQIEGKIANWVRDLQILEIGDGLIEKLVSSGLVEDVSDLYLLTAEDLENLDRMGSKSAKNVIKSLWSRNPISLDILLGALSIPLIGSASIRLLIDAGYNTLDKIMELKQTDMESVKGLGPSRSESLCIGLKQNKEMVEKMIDNGLDIKSEETKSGGKLSGLSFVFTGAMVNKRAVLQQMVTDNGGVNKASVGAGLSFLVLEDDTTTKAAKAKKLNVKCISEQQFLDMIEA